MNVVTSINMSNYIASDVPLSPISADWDSPAGLDLSSLHYSYPMGSSGSPVPVSKMLRGRMSPDNSDSEPQLCLPTSQVFDMSYAPTPEPMSSPPSESEQLPPTPPSRHASVVPSKRPSTSTTSASKKVRGNAVSTKDYVPPDVSGLSKREARLVKNRAAAFLSRQRKREEFENMEQRVAELEQENARLMALAHKKPEAPKEELLSEVEQLRAQLAAAEARERELSEQLTRKSEEPSRAPTPEPELPLVPRVAPSQSLHKSGASLGLMVLLCALPTLLTLPTHSNMPTTFSLPLSNANSVSASSALDMQSFMPGDFDWMTSGSGSMMDFDMDGLDLLSRPRVDSSKKLEFVDEDSEALGLSGLDISFDATPSEDGKIRVRIHPPASSSVPVSSAPSPEASSDGDDQSMFGGSDFGSAPSPEASDFLSDDKLGPFLGVGSDFPSMAIDSTSPDLSSPTSTSFSSSGLSEPFDFNFGDLTSGFSVTTSTGRRRVRIALKSMPGQGREGGEWEVQLC
ncbi:hypothetical protein BDY19DRAFT_904951 [Irpex rosettiformis]|uniref:Uncharacterized protein n=1 Tax=Irpex rosettiformis TaxID=378272 RepID=A0ACB8U8W6_9APHY|nr:hypothetical protein BDY19DRAFT_904951 [Irpex rosettiformis]